MTRKIRNFVCQVVDAKKMGKMIGKEMCQVRDSRKKEKITWERGKSEGNNGSRIEDEQVYIRLH